MVQLNSSFSETRFVKWRAGWGFGRASRDYLNDPSIARTGRFTPSGDLYYGSNPFWRGSLEQDRAAGIGIGDRPDYGKAQGDYIASPDSYNPSKHFTRRSVIYNNLRLKSRVSDPQERYRNSATSGPGPAAYDIRKEPGYSCPKITIQTRKLDTRLFNEEIYKPGPDQYDQRQPLLPPDAFPRGREKAQDNTRHKGPGPGQYTLRDGDFDKFNLEPVGWRPPWLAELDEMRASQRAL